MDALLEVPLEASAGVVELIEKDRSRLFVLLSAIVELFVVDDPLRFEQLSKKNMLTKNR